MLQESTAGLLGSKLWHEHTDIPIQRYCCCKYGFNCAFQLNCMTQIWKAFRQESYTRHRIIGRIVMISLLISHVTAAVIAGRHLQSDKTSEKV